MERDGWFRLSATIEGLDSGPGALWFEIEPQQRDSISPLADPFAVGLLFPAMQAGAPLHVRGSVSRSLLESLEHFQTIWTGWRPERYRRVEVTADHEVRGTAADGDPIVMFSGGLDGAFSLYRRKRGLMGPRSQRVAAALMVLGFDIPLEDQDQFPAAAAGSRRMLAGIGVELWTMRTNFRTLPVGWEDGHGTALAASLHTLAAGHRTGVISGSTFFKPLNAPWGSNPMTDPLLSSDRMTIVHDGGDIQRHLKPELVSAWPELMEDLRVCYRNPERDRNCGVCSKCVLTKLAFMASDLPIPTSLQPAPTDEQIVRTQLDWDWGRDYARLLLERARAHGLQGSRWYAALERCLMRHGSLWQKARSRLPRVSVGGGGLA